MRTLWTVASARFEEFFERIRNHILIILVWCSITAEFFLDGWAGTLVKIECEQTMGNAVRRLLGTE
jgi:hypothetical protein